ncbi:TonB-dependent receptor plug domain-containing protein [Zhongshania arctica]|uniref:TonB-dependent receptor plug domain-containing protein n=1 Tax=Zhongshania arctica TaxID=3238302 RepID=A0ABV3TVC9_9GAMM
MPKLRFKAADTFCRKSGRNGLSILAVFISVVNSSYAVNSEPMLLARAGDLASMSLESLMNIDVVSVSKHSEPLQQSAAAVFVLEGSTIVRSGVKSIPEALRLIPGVQVARLDSHSWAITARGFNSTLADKLEVLMDGRSLYTPLYSGVFWDSQDTLLDDVARIEVIRGPGAALWGANAVNGVVNIVTKSAAETQGSFHQVGGGSEFKGFGAWRYGGEVGDLGHYRVYAKTTHYNAQETPGAGDAQDAGKHNQLGFRSDLKLSDSDTLTLQGDYYTGAIQSPATSKDELASGYNVISRWKRRYDESSDTEIQFIYDQTSRDNRFNFAEDRNTYDLDIKHRFAVGERQSFVLGGGYRVTDDDITNLEPSNTEFTPLKRRDQTLDLFVQDQIVLIPDTLQLTLGAKYERNDYTGEEFQPSVRFGYILDDRNTFWGAVSRAVRIPNRLDHTIEFFDGFIVGDEHFKSEEVLAYELGYRAIFKPTLSADLAVFYNEYDKLRGVSDDLAQPQTLPVRIVNAGSGTSQGVELVMRWEPLQAVKILGSYTYFDMDVAAYAGSRDTSIAQNDESDPNSQVSLQLDWDIGDKWSLQTRARWVGGLDGVAVDSYSALDISAIWRLTRDLDFTLIGSNLLDPQHAEFSGGNEISRSLNGQFTWHF